MDLGLFVVSVAIHKKATLKMESKVKSVKSRGKYTKESVQKKGTKTKEKRNDTNHKKYGLLYVFLHLFLPVETM